VQLNDAWENRPVNGGAFFISNCKNISGIIVRVSVNYFSRALKELIT
jgi:hypothetical protein